MRVKEFKKWLKNFFADRVTAILFSFTVLFALCTIISVVFPADSLVSYAVNAASTVPVGEIYDGKKLEMEYQCTHAGLAGISFATATYSHVMTEGTLFVIVMDEDGKTIYSGNFPGPSIKDNSTLDITFPIQPDSKNMRYTVALRTDGLDQSQSITFWANGDKPEGASTLINGEVQPYSLVFSVVCNAKTYRYTWDLFLLCNISLVLTVAAYSRNGSKKENE